MIPKQLKQFGQHFLIDETIISNIVEKCLSTQPKQLLEIGPGPGVITQHLAPQVEKFQAAEIDQRMVQYLMENNILLQDQIYPMDILSLNPNELFDGEFHLVGNFPYNISTPIMMWLIKYYEQIPVMTGMFQKEVAERIASGPNSRKYGSLSVFIQWFYEVEYLFSVPAEAFDPPPKVKSGVIHLVRRESPPADLDFIKFSKMVKALFALKRKTIRNNLKAWNSSFIEIVPEETLQKRAEQMSQSDLIQLYNLLYNS